MRLRLSKVIFMFFLLLQNLAEAQMIVAVDQVNSDFFGYNISSNEFIDFRIDTTSTSNDAYISIAKLNNNVAFVGMIKRLDSGVEQPMIIKYNSIEKSYEEIILDSIESPSSITLDHLNDKMYWVDSELDQIRRANYDGTDIELYADMFEEFLPGRKPAIGIDDDDRVFGTNGGFAIFLADTYDWSPAQLGSIYFEDPDHNIPPVHFGGIIGDIVVDLTEPYFYWSNNTNESAPHIIKQERGIGTGWEEEQIVIDGQEQFFELALFSERIYWTGKESVVFSADKNGNDIRQEIASNHSISDFIVRNDASTSIKETEELALIGLSPNPVIDNISLSSIPPGNNYYSIVGANGLSYEKHEQITEGIIKVEKLLPGLYFLIIYDEAGHSIIKKFIK